MRTERRRKLDRTDIAVICLCFAVTGLVIYLMLDPDPARRRMSYYYTLYTGAQKLAASIGEFGINAELEYRRLLELERTI
jgi:hypothetical protein